MTIASLAVGVQSESSAEKLIAISADIAERHAAHLLGLHVVPPNDIYIPAELPYPMQLLERQARQRQQHAEALQGRFESMTCARACVSEWRTITDVPATIAETTIEIASTVDLLVLERGDPAHAGSSRRELPERVIADCPRPVLVVPDTFGGDGTFKRAFVAWDGRPESTRAVFGALPLLRAAETVRLHRMNPPDVDRHRIVGITEDLASTLSRHGVPVEVAHSDAPLLGVGDELLGFAGDLDADLIVMGAWSHSRVRDFVLGSTTRQVLAATRIPVLMSH